MADENTIDFPALCEELSARVVELEAALSEEQEKNAVLVQQVVEAEDNIANREVESFADVIDAEDKEFFRERLIENREATLGLLNRMRTRKTVVTEVVTPPSKPLQTAPPQVILPRARMTSSRRNCATVHRRSPSGTDVASWSRSAGQRSNCLKEKENKDYDAIKYTRGEFPRPGRRRPDRESGLSG